MPANIVVSRKRPEQPGAGRDAGQPASGRR